MSRKALGRGLDALIPQTASGSNSGSESKPHTPDASSPGSSSGEAVLMVDIDKVVPNRRQPRSALDEVGLAELTDSVRERGVLEPLLVRPVEGGRYELVAGERRLRASQRAGKTQVPVLVRQVGDRASLEIALIENIQREDLNPIDEALAYRRLVEEFGRTHAEISKAVGKDRSTISNLLRLLKLPQDVLRHVSLGMVSVGHARALLNVEAEDQQVALTEQMMEEGWSVRETERFVAALQSGAAPPSPLEAKASTEPESSIRDPQVARVEEALRRLLGTEVRLSHGPKGGKIEIKYFSKDELERILDTLGAEVL